MSALPELSDVTDALVAHATERGAASYIRERHLAPLIGDWRDMTDAEIVTRLKIKLHAMQRLMLATGHWTGDANRVIALRQALAGELPQMIERIPIESRERGREEWLRLRERNIGASEAGALLGVHDYLTPFELYARKSGLVTADIPDNPAMRRGRLLEPVALQMLKEERPEWTVEPNPIPGGVYFQDTELRLAATPDALVVSDRGRGVAQVKSVEARSFTEKWCSDDGIQPPVWICIQVLVEALLTGAEWACVVALVVDHGIRIEVIDVPIHAPIIARIKAAAADFWRMIDEGREPPPDYGRDSAIIEQLFSQPEEIEIDLTGDNSLPEAVAEYFTLGKSLAELGDLRRARRAEILHKLGDASAARIATGRITANSIKRKAHAVAESSYRAIKFREDVP